MTRKLFPMHKLHEADVLRRHLAPAVGAKIVVVDVEDVSLDKQAADALGGEPIHHWLLKQIAETAGAPGVFYVPTPEEMEVAARESAEIDHVLEEWGGNPFQPGIRAYNLTAQIRIREANPALAKKLEQMAKDERAIWQKKLDEKAAEKRRLFGRGK